MAKRVKDRHCECEAIHIARQESPLPASALQSARYVVQGPNGNVELKVLIKGFEQSYHVEVFFSPRMHIDNPENPIVAAEQGHEGCVVEELRTGFAALFVCSLEGGLAAVEPRSRQKKVWVLIIVFIFVHLFNPWPLLRIPSGFTPSDTIDILLCLRSVLFGYKMRAGMRLRWVSR